MVFVDLESGRSAVQLLLCDLVIARRVRARVQASGGAATHATEQRTHQAGEVRRRVGRSRRRGGAVHAAVLLVFAPHESAAPMSSCCCSFSNLHATVRAQEQIQKNEGNPTCSMLLIGISRLAGRLCSWRWLAPAQP